MAETIDALLDLGRLEQIAAERSGDFASAKPFPHVVIDDFLPEDTASALLEDHRKSDCWHTYVHYSQRKLAITDPHEMRPFTRSVFEALQSDAFIQVLERLSGVEDLLPDPELDGAGLHKIPCGGFLNLHTDFLAHHTNTSWSRQLNLLVFLNPDWEPAWHGELELWDADVTQCVQRVEPLFNRAVLFRTLPNSYHGHPEPLTCPPNAARRSIALYYFRDEGKPVSVKSTHYRADPSRGRIERALVAADRGLVRLHSYLKRYVGLTDERTSSWLRRFWKKS